MEVAFSIEDLKTLIGDQTIVIAGKDRIIAQLDARNKELQAALARADAEVTRLKGE